MGSVQRLDTRRYRAYAGRQVNGKRTIKTKLFTTKKAAEEWIVLTEERMAAEANGGMPAEDITVAELLERWLTSRSRELRPGTIEGYRATIRAHIEPHIGRHSVRDLTPYLVQSWIDDRVEAGVGLTMLNHAVKRLRTALDSAVRLGLIATNPAQLVDAPSAGKPRQAILTRAEIELLLTQAEADHFHPLWHLLVLAGLRRGEALGLRWQDVDLQAREIHVKQTVQVINHRPCIGQPKTAAAVRTIAIPDRLVQALRIHKDRQAFAAAAVGELWLSRDLVVCTETGGPHNPANIYDHLEAMLDRAGVKQVRVHDLRHTYASHLIADGVPLPIIARQLGHASPAITMAVYAHMLPGQQREAADAIERLFGGGPV